MLQFTSRRSENINDNLLLNQQKIQLTLESSLNKMDGFVVTDDSTLISTSGRPPLLPIWPTGQSIPLPPMQVNDARGIGFCAGFVC